MTTFNFWENKGVFATNSDILITISLQPNAVVDLRYFKLWILLDKIIQVWYIKVLPNQVVQM